MADLQTIYYRIKLNSEGTEQELLPVEKAIERIRNLIKALGTDVPANDPRLKLYNRQLRDLQEINRQNRVWYKDVEAICNKLAEISTKELQAALKQTQKEWRDLAQAEIVDQKRLEELRRRESIIQDEMAKRDIRRRAFAEDYRKINELTNSQLREGARQSKAALDTLHKNTDEMREMLKYATAYSDKLAEANGKLSVGKAVEMGSSADKSVHTIEQLNEGLSALQSHVKDFGQYMDDDMLSDFNARIGVIQRRVRDVAQSIAETGNVAPGQRANIAQMEQAQRVLSDWQRTADASVQSSVNTWLANITHMIKDAKTAIASAADGSMADEARRLLARSKSGMADSSREAEKARQDSEKATQARIAAAKAEAEHQVNIQQIEKDRATAIDEANRKHAETVHLAQLEVEASEENVAAYKSELEVAKQRDAYIVEQQKKVEQAEKVEKDHRQQAEKFEAERMKHAAAAAEAESHRAQAAEELARVQISTEQGYHAAIQKRAEAEAHLQQTQAEQGKYIKEANAIQSEINEKTNEQNTLLAKQSGLLHQANLDRRRIKELETPVKPVVSDGMSSAASLAAPDEALRQALGRPSLSKKLTVAIGGVGETIKEGLGEVGDEVAENFMTKFIGKVKGQMRNEMPRTANDVRSSVSKALDAVVKQLNLSQDQSASLHARLASISTATMTELGEVARSSTSGITYVMRELRNLTEQEMSDLQRYDEIAKGTDEKAKKRLDALNSRLRELTMTGITRLAQESGIPSEGLSKIRERLFTPDEKTGAPSFDGLLRGIAGRMGDDKDIRDLFAQNVTKLLSDAFGKTDEDKELAGEFFGRLRSSFVDILKNKVPSTNDEMRPILKALMDGIAADMQLTPEQTDKIAKSFESNIKTATLKPLRDRAIEMRRGDDGSFTEAKYLVGQLLTGNGWQDFPGRMDPKSLPTGEPAMPARQYRDKIAKMLSGYSRGDGGLAGALGANGGAVQPLVNELKLADEKLAKLQNSLREDTPQSLKDVRKAISDMMNLVTVDMQRIISANNGKLPEAIRDNMIAAIGNAIDLVDTEIPKIYQDAARKNNGLANGISEMQSRLSTIANKGTIGREMSDIINSDHFVDDLKVLLKEKPHQSKQELIKIVQDYLRQEADMLLKAGKVSQESVDKAVDYAQKMIGEKSVSKVYQQLLSPGSYYNADVVAKGTDAIVGNVQRQVKAMTDTLSGTNTLNPFEAMVDSLANKKDTGKLTEGWAKEIKTLKESLSSVPEEDKSGILQSIEGLTRLSSLTDELKSKIAADGGKTDVYTIIRQHIESLLDAHRKEGEAIAAEGMELNKRIQQEIEENGELFEVTEGEAALFSEKQRRYEASKAIFNEMQKSLSSLTTAQTAQQKAEAEAAEKNRQNAAEAEHLKAERRQRIQDAWDARRAAIESGKAVQELAQMQTEAQQKADSYTGTIKAQNEELDKQTRLINNAHVNSALEFENTQIQSLTARKEGLQSELSKLNADYALAQKALDRISKIKVDGPKNEEESALLTQETSFLKMRDEYEQKSVVLLAKKAAIDEKITAHRKLQQSAAESEEKWNRDMVAYLNSVKSAVESLDEEKKSLSGSEAIKADTMIGEYKEAIADGNKAIASRAELAEKAATEATRLKGIISEQSEIIKDENRQQQIALQNKNEEIRLADQQVEKAKKYRENIEQTNQAIEQSSQAVKEAVAAQQRLDAARKAVADLRTSDPTLLVNEEYQQRVAAADKELADAKEAARIATDNERQSLEAYNAALSKNGGVSIAHLKQMREQIQYLKENVDDNAAIEEYGHLLAQINKRIAELDAAPLRTVGEAIAEAQSLLSKPLQRVDTSAEEAAVADARNVAQQRHNELQAVEIENGKQIAALEKEWADDEQNRVAFQERRAAAVGNDVEKAKAAVAAADQQAFIDEKTAAVEAATAEKAELETQREQLETQVRLNEEKRKQAGFDDDITEKGVQRLGIEQQVIAAQQKLSEKPLQDAEKTLEAEREMASIDDHRLETERKREQLRQKLNYQAEQEIKELQADLAKETDATRQERLNRRIDSIRKNGPSKYNSQSQQNDDYLWREGNAKLQEGRETLLDIQRQRGEIAAKRQELEKQNVLVNENNNRKMLAQFKTVAAEYGKVIADNKDRLTQMAVDVDHAFISEAFLGQLRDKYKKVFESVLYNANTEAGAAFRVKIDEMFRKDMEVLNQTAYNITTGLAKEGLNTKAAEEVGASARNYLQHNLGIWALRTDGEDIQQQHAKLDESKKQTEESKKQTEESRKQTDEKRKQTDQENKQTEKKHVDLTADQKKLVDTYFEKKKAEKDELDRVKSLHDYAAIQKAAKADGASEEDKKKYNGLFAAKNAIQSEASTAYNALKAQGVDLNKVENEYISQKQVELGLVKEIKQAEQSVTDEKKQQTSESDKQTDSEKSKKQQQAEQRKSNKIDRLDKQERDLDRQERNTLEMMGKREGAQDYYKTTQGLAKLDRLDAEDQARLSELQSVIDLAPKASKEWLNYNAAKQQVAEAQAKYDKEKTDANLDELNKAQQRLDENTEALVLKHGTEQQITDYNALKQSITELNEKNSEFVTEESRIVNEMAAVDEQIKEAETKISGYTTAIEGAKKAMENLGTARENLAKAEAAAAEWDQKNPYDGKISQEQYDQRKQQLADNLAAARQAHQEALDDVAAQQNILRQAAAEGSASLQQLKESYAELQRDFQISNDQSERDLIGTNMANLKALIDKLDIKPVRELNEVIADVAKEGSVQGLQRLRQELQDIAQFSKNADIRNSALAEIANLDKRLEKMNTAPLRDMVAIMGDLSVAKSADQVKRYITELRNLATSGTLTKQQIEQVNSELFKQEQRYKEMTTVTFSYSRAKSVLTAAEQLAAQGSKAEAEAVRKMIEQLKVAMNAEKLTLEERSQMISVMKQLESSERASAGMMMEKAQAEQILADAEALVAKGLDANNGKVREQLVLLEQARQSKNIDLALEKQLAEVQKSLQTNLNAEAKKSAKSFMPLWEAVDVYENGITETSGRIKDAIESIKHSLNDENIAPTKIAELNDMLKTLQDRLKGDGYDQSWLDNLLGGKNENIGKAKLKDLERALRMVQSEMKEVERSSDADAKKFAQLQNRARLLDAEIKRTSGSLGQMNNNMENQVDWFTRATSKLASYLGVFGGLYMLRQQLQQAWQENIRYSDSLTDIQKTTQLTAESVKALATELKFLDTRTSIDGLNQLAYSAGKLGVKGVADVMGFTRAADQINIALGEQLGQGSEAVEQIYKMVNVMGDVQEFGLEKALLKVGSSINHLTMNTAASAQPMVNFARRLAGVAKQAGMSSADLMGWAASVNSLGQNVELSATSLSKLMVQLSSNSKVVAAALGMTQEETEAFRYDIDTGHISEALLTVMQKANEAGGLSHLSTIIKDLSGSDGQRVVQTLSTLASNYEQVAHMVRMSNDAFEEGVSVTNEYNLKNQNAAALWEKLQKSFSKMLISPQNVDAIKTLLIRLQDLPDALQKLITMLSPVGKMFLWIAEQATQLTHVLVSLIEAMAFRSLVAGIGTLGKWFTGLGRLSHAWSVAASQVNRYGMSVDTARGKTARFFTFLKTASFGNVFTAIAAILFEIGNYFYQASIKAKEWKKNAEEAMAGVSAQTKQTTAQLEKLLKQYKDAGDSEIKRKDILTELNNSYGDYISNLITEKSSYEDVAKAIRSANAELRAKALLEARDAQLNTVENEHATSLNNRVDSAITSIMKIVEKDRYGNVIERTAEEKQALAAAVETGINNLTSSRDVYEKIYKVAKYDDQGRVELYGRSETDHWFTSNEGLELIKSQFSSLGVDFTKPENVRRIIDAMMPYVNELNQVDVEKDKMSRVFNRRVRAIQDEKVFEDENGNPVGAKEYVESLIQGTLGKVRSSIEGTDFKFTRYTADDDLVKQGVRRAGEAYTYYGDDQDRYYADIKNAFGTSREGIEERNALQSDLASFIEDAKRGLEILKPRLSGNTDPTKYTETDKQYQELLFLYNSANSELEILSRGAIEDKEDSSEAKTKTQKAMDFLNDLIAKFEDFYKRQELSLQNMKNAGLPDADYEEFIERNTRERLSALATLRDRFLGDVDLNVYEDMIKAMDDQNVRNKAGQAGREILESIIAAADPKLYGDIIDEYRTRTLSVITSKPVTVPEHDKDQEQRVVEVKDPKTRKDFILYMRPIIQRALQDSGFVSRDDLEAYTDMLTGQAYLESRSRTGSGLSGLALKYNNFSGMIRGTTSNKNRGSVSLTNADGQDRNTYAVFDSAEDWAAEFVAYLNRKWSAFDEGVDKYAAQLLSNDAHPGQRYATDPKYADKLKASQKAVAESWSKSKGQAAEFNTRYVVANPLSQEESELNLSSNAFMSKQRYEADKNRADEMTSRIKEAQKVAKAWIEQNPIGQLNRQYFDEFRTLGLVLHDFTKDSGADVDKLQQQVMDAFYEIGRATSGIDINRLATKDRESGLEEFRKYVKKFPVFAAEATGATVMQLRGIYYKSYEYVEEYDDRMRRLAEKSIKRWKKIFDNSDTHHKFTQMQSDLDVLQKKLTELEPYGLSKMANLYVSLEKAQKKYNDSLEELSFKVSKAVDHKRAAEALVVGSEITTKDGRITITDNYKKSEIESANKELKELENEGVKVREIYNEVLEAQRAIREATWSWLHDMTDAFSTFMDGFVPFRSWYDDKGRKGLSKRENLLLNVFGTKEERQKAFGDFMDTIKKAVRASVMAQAELAMTRWLKLPEKATKQVSGEKKKASDDVDRILAPSRLMVDNEALAANKASEFEIIHEFNVKQEEELQRHVDEENRIKGVNADGTPVEAQDKEAEHEAEFQASKVEADLNLQQMAADATLAIQQQMEESKQRLVEKGIGRIFDVKKKRAKDEQKLDKSTADVKVKAEQKANTDVEKSTEELADVQQTAAVVTGNVLTKISGETAEKEKQDNVESTTTSMWGSFGEAIAKAWAQGGPYLGPVLAAVVSAALGAVMTMVFNMIGGGKKTAVTPKTKLVQGMLTYDGGNVQSFAGVRTYNNGTGAQKRTINMLPVMGDDGRVYMVPEGDLMDKNDMSQFTGMVTRPTLTTIGGAPALVAERGPEMVIGRETTHQMQMYRPDLFRQILEFDRNRSRGFAKTFDEGNLSDIDAADNSSLLTPNSSLQTGMSEETGELLATAISALYVQLQNPIRAELNTNGKDGAVDKMAQAMLNSLRLGDLESVKRLFAKR